VHEHAWLSAGYGIWGKEEYLKRFWTVLDWKKVSDAFALFALKRTGN
jgi:Fe-Mn family superoxide dismutase